MSLLTIKLHSEICRTMVSISIRLLVIVIAHTCTVALCDIYASTNTPIVVVFFCLFLCMYACQLVFSLKMPHQIASLLLLTGSCELFKEL